MDMTIDEYVKYVMTRHGDINIYTRAQDYSPQEIADALAKATPDTEEAFVLSLMAKAHPLTTQNTTTNDTTGSIGTTRSRANNSNS